MISIARLAKTTERLLANNSPLVLTVMGATGVVATGILAAKAGFKASQTLAFEDAQRTVIGEPMTSKEKFKLTWVYYLPAAAVGTTSIVAIVAANRIGTRRAAAMATALTISERAFNDYQSKVIERYGDLKEREIRDSVQQDRVTRDPVESKEVIILTGDQLCYDAYSGRYFQSTMENLKHAINRLNHRIINDNYASLTDFYNYIGLERTAISDDVGWNVGELLDVHFTTTLSSDGRPALAMEYKVSPTRDYFRIH